MNMIQPEYAPILARNRQDYLRSLGIEADKPRITPRRARRQAVGERLVRFGQWLEGQCPDLTFGGPVPAYIPAHCK